MTLPDLTADRRLLLVHAHPDDESIQNGITMAKYAAEGAQVTLVTCTLGEEGEVLVPELAHLAAEHEDGLGEHRIGELAEAMRILGVTDHRFLGGPGRYRDTGMVYAEGEVAMVPPVVRDDSFWAADLVTVSNDYSKTLTEAQIKTDGFGHAIQVNVAPSLGRMGKELMGVTEQSKKFSDTMKKSVSGLNDIFQKAFEGGGGGEGGDQILRDGCPRGRARDDSGCRQGYGKESAQPGRFAGWGPGQAGRGALAGALRQMGHGPCW